MHAVFPRLLLVASALLAGPALAHPTHVENVAGHSHWLALGAVVGACLIAAAAGAVYQTRRRAAPPQRSE